MTVLKGKTAIVTGASQGLGEAIAEAFLNAGASLMLCARTQESLDGVKAKLSAQATDGQVVLTRQCDVSVSEQVDALFDSTVEALGRIDILVNNAGIYGPMGPIDEVVWKEWIRALEINLFGTVYPCRLAFTHFKRNGGGKIINISGGGATAPMPNVSSYAASKAAVVRMTETLAEEGRPFKIEVNAVAPGALLTRLTDQLLDAGPNTVGEALYSKIKRVKDQGGTPLSLGADLCVWLASAASDGVTGKLISAQWDPWNDLQSHLEDLDHTDIYTLRRIVPKDRGKDWGDL